jgi:hypothetical protein
MPIYGAGERAENSSYAEATERSPMDDGPLEFLLSTDCSVPLQCCLACVNLTTALVANDGNHIIIIMDIQLNRMTRQLEGNTGKFAGGGMLEMWRGLIHRTSLSSLRRLPQK